MLTRFLRSFAALALVTGVAVAAGTTTARAGVVVDFTTAGEFSATGTNAITSNGITITFVGRPDASLPLETPTNTDFGAFHVTGTAINSGGSFTSQFTLTIDQTVPSNGTADFPPATLTGSITINGSGVGNSTAYVQFTSPLTQMINSLVSYKIINADDSTPGKINLPASGSASINGQISAVPEPATLAIAFSALPLLGLGAWRQSRKRS